MYNLQPVARRRPSPAAACALRQQPTSSGTRMLPGTVTAPVGPPARVVRANAFVECSAAHVLCGLRS